MKWNASGLRVYVANMPGTQPTMVWHVLPVPGLQGLAGRWAQPPTYRRDRCCHFPERRSHRPVTKQACPVSGQHFPVGPALLTHKLTLSLKIKKIHVSVAPEVPFLEIHPTDRLAHVQSDIMYKVLHCSSIGRKPKQKTSWLNYGTPLPQDTLTIRASIQQI